MVIIFNILNTQQQLINKLINTGVLKTPRIVRAFKDVDRIYFVRNQDKAIAYYDEALPIGFEATISQPTTVAIMLELLQPHKGDIILDVGSGSGWTSALLSYIAGEEGMVYGVELILDLVKFSRNNLTKFYKAYSKQFRNLKLLQVKKDVLGLPNKAPFDKILVSASAQDLPQELVTQLKSKGRLVIPVQHSIWKIDKNLNDDITKKEYPGFVFVPLR